MQARASLSRHVKSQVRKFMQTYNKQVNSWWFAVKTQDIYETQDTLKMLNSISQQTNTTSRPTETARGGVIICAQLLW